MTTTPIALADLATVDEAARVLVAACKATNVDAVHLRVSSGGRAELMGHGRFKRLDWDEVVHATDPEQKLSAALARRLGAEAPTPVVAPRLAPFERTVLFRVLDGYPLGPKHERRQTTAALSRLRRKGLMVPGSAMELTPAGRAYLASAAGGVAKEER